MAPRQRELIRLSLRNDVTVRRPGKAPWASVGRSAAGMFRGRERREPAGDRRLILPCRDVRIGSRPACQSLPMTGPLCGLKRTHRTKRFDPGSLRLSVALSNRHSFWGHLTY